MPWHVGHKVGRNIYSGEGSADTVAVTCGPYPEACALATLIVAAVNDVEAEIAADLDVEASAKCVACFTGACEACMEQRGTGGDGQPCRCAHAGWYAEGLSRLDALVDRLCDKLVDGQATLAAMERRAEAAEADWHLAEHERDQAVAALAEVRTAFGEIARTAIAFVALIQQRPTQQLPRGLGGCSDEDVRAFERLAAACNRVVRKIAP